MVFPVFNNRRTMVTWAKEQCMLLNWHNIRSKIIIHTRDGRIAREYTYGNDPKRSRG